MPAARHVQRPERRVLQGHIAYGKVFDCLKQHHARAERLAEFRAFVEAVVHILVQKHLVALTVDRAHAADGHIFGVAGPQKEAALPAVGGVVRSVPSPPCGNGVISAGFRLLISTAPLSRCSSTLSFSSTEPLKKRPAGTITRPPPAAAAASTPVGWLPRSWSHRLPQRRSVRYCSPSLLLLIFCLWQHRTIPA